MSYSLWDDELAPYWLDELLQKHGRRIDDAYRLNALWMHERQQ